MDLVSTLLNQIPVNGRAIGLLTLQGDWAIQSPETEEAVFHLISKGSLIITFRGQDIYLREGDMILFTHGETHLLASAPGAPRVTFEEDDTRVRIHSVEGGEVHDVRKRGDGPETDIVCARFDLGSAAASHLVRSFPDNIRISGKEDSKAALLDPLLRAIAKEAHSEAPGALAALDGMLNLLFIHFMRDWLGQPSDDHQGWLKGLQDPNIAKALQLMHDAPARDWSVQDLATQAGMSRSQFAARFAELIGEPPLRYLTRWRMVLAALELEKGSDRPIIDIALSVGYQSEASFSASFKRQFGQPPGAWRKNNPVTARVA